MSSGAPGLIVVAPRSGGGKTTFALGLMRALRLRGMRPVGVKCGPDYIDPAFHAAATGHAGANLDSWAMEPALVAHLAHSASVDADIVIGEGLMGLFDGVKAEPGRTGSSADICAALHWPALLVLDVSGQSQSAAATALGCATYDPRIKLCGVVLNRVGSERHRRLVAESIEAIGLPLIGALPRNTEISLPERHLGLVQAEETSELESVLDRLAQFVEANVDVARIVGLAQRSASPTPDRETRISPPGQRIAVARDAAFSFVYPHLLQSWRDAGAEVLFFSPLNDEAPRDDCDLCWLPGGYPELHAGALAGADRFQNSMRVFAETRPVHGECGGYMVLGRALVDASGGSHSMLGLLGHVTSFEKRRMTLGYREAELLEAGPLGHKGTLLRGHEFHYATIAEAGDDAPFALARDAHGAPPAPTGGRRGCVSGSFFHMIAPVRSQE